MLTKANMGIYIPMFFVLLILTADLVLHLV